jgi:nicotinamidase-related amidase
MRPALVVIDMQRWFYDENPQPFRDKLLPNVAAALALARSAAIPVVHVITRYSQDRSDWPKVYRDRDKIWCLEGTDGVQILDEARPLPGEPVVVKTRFSGFYDSELDATLQGLGVDTLVFAGYSSDVCVRLTVMDAYNRGYDQYLLADCVHAGREDTEASIEYLRWLTNITVIDAKEMVSICRTQ